jgi:hypothetical protein
VSGLETAVREEGFHLLGQLEQAQHVCDVHAALADAAGGVLLRQLEEIDEVAIRARFLEWVEVGALDVLDDGLLERLAVVDLPDDRRDARGAGEL